MIFINDSRGHERIFQSRERGRGGWGGGDREGGGHLLALFFFFLRAPFSNRSIDPKWCRCWPRNLQILTIGCPLVLMINWRETACTSWDNLSKTDKKEKTEWSFNPFTLKNDQQWWGIEHPPAKTVWFNTRLFELKFKETGIVNGEEKMILRSWEWRG